MKERRAFSVREPWPLWRRAVHRLLLNAPALFAAALLTVLAIRWLPHDKDVVFTPVGWPEAWIVAFAYVGVPIYKAAAWMAKHNPKGLLDEVFSRFGIGEVAGTDNGTSEDLLMLGRRKVQEADLG